ncbi:hypothetical protein F511_12002 [Dorcoceras hygrometricum]|uniref:Uncharacterized protein n=1 Tax=Dorcoceras hygrometricum TaxID=472368 RepID=A0A2Z7D9R4_9LAMI|nr:hypothetical protein F511_12002 [Dorcoceras hygrometricum]
MHPLQQRRPVCATSAHATAPQSHGQRAIVLRIVRDASRRTRMRCARDGAALQAAAIGQKKKFLSLMRSEIQQVRYNYGKSTETPSSGCTRSTDEFCMNGFSSSNRPERIPATGGGGARRRRRRELRGGEGG